MTSNHEETDNLVNGTGSSVVSIGQTNGSAHDLENCEPEKTNDVTVDHMSSYADMKNYAKGCFRRDVLGPCLLKQILFKRWVFVLLC